MTSAVAPTEDEGEEQALVTGDDRLTSGLARGLSAWFDSARRIDPLGRTGSFSMERRVVASPGGSALGQLKILWSSTLSVVENAACD